MDAAASSEFETSLSDWISKGDNNFLLNFTDLDLHKQCGSQEHSRHFQKTERKEWENFSRGITWTCGEVFKVSGFMSIFRVFATAEAALREI